MTATATITDHQRFCFMQKLAAEVRAKNGLILDQWEENFLAGWRRSSQPHSWFIGERPKFVDRMWIKYATEIGLPFPLMESKPAKLTDADADCCEYIVQIDGRHQRCNDPAAWQRQNGFRYCIAHAEGMQRDLKRQGKVVHLLKFP